MPISGECEHGQLARQCQLCEYEAEIEEFEAKVAILEKALKNLEHDMQTEDTIKNCKVGNLIWTYNGGWEKVIAINPHTTYPVETLHRCYTYEGMLSKFDKHPSAFPYPPSYWKRRCKLVEAERDFTKNSKDGYLPKNASYWKRRCKKVERKLEVIGDIKMNSDLSTCKVGDIVWTIREGWTTLIEVFSHNGAVVKVITDITSSDVNGLENETDKYPMIYLEPPKEFNAEPKPCGFKKGDKVLVSDYTPDCSNRRYFSHVSKDGLYHCYIEGRSDWTSEDGYTNPWKYCKKWEEGEDE